MIASTTNGVILDIQRGDDVDGLQFKTITLTHADTKDKNFLVWFSTAVLPRMHPDWRVH